MEDMRKTARFFYELVYLESYQIIIRQIFQPWFSKMYSVAFESGKRYFAFRLFIALLKCSKVTPISF